MASPTSSTEYNLFIKPSKILDAVSTKEDKTTEYVILQNNELVSRHIENINTINALKVENEELEEYNSTLERGKTCIQGIAKNQYLLNQEKTKCIAHYQLKLSTCHRHVIHANLFTLPLLICCFVNVFAIKLTVCIILLTMQGKQAIQHFRFYKRVNTESHFLKTQEKIQELDKSTETLHDLIDNY